MSQSGNPILMILDDKEEAAYLLNELETIFKKDEILFLPGSYRRPYEIEETNNANVVLRTEILNTLNGTRKLRCIITDVEIIFEKLVMRKIINTKSIYIY